MSERKPSKYSKYAVMAMEAEASVVMVKDAELRRVAFDRILAALLDGGKTKSENNTHDRKQKRSSNAANKIANALQVKTRQGPKARVEDLIDEGFFKEQRAIAEVKNALADRGHHIVVTSLSGPMQKLTQERRLRRQKVRAQSDGSKEAYLYSNW